MYPDWNVQGPQSLNPVDFDLSFSSTLRLTPMVKCFDSYWMDWREILVSGELIWNVTLVIPKTFLLASAEGQSFHLFTEI